MNLLHHQPKRVPTEDQKQEPGYGALQSQDSSRSLADSLQETWQAKIFPNLPKTVDTIIACLGLSLTLIAMLSVESWTGFRLYSLSMSASGVSMSRASPKGKLATLTLILLPTDQLRADWVDIHLVCSRARLYVCRSSSLHRSLRHSFKAFLWGQHLLLLSAG